MHSTFKFQTFGLLLVLLLASGCSSFERQWKKTVQAPTPADGLTGAWEGRWLSHANGHNDKLRCLVTSDPQKGTHARFHAKYKKIFSFGYTVPLEARQETNRWIFKGEA